MGKPVAERRRQEALELAKRYAEWLRQCFGARRVIPFGSLVGDSPWHSESDLDLAVEGLSSQALWEAQKQLEDMAPAWLSVDLVPLEHVYPELRERILGGQSMPEDIYAALRQRLQDELVAIERTVRGLEAGLVQAGDAPDEFALRALASYLDDFYKSCERICERVAVTLDGGLPTGERWHQRLLGQMGEAGGHNCPALFGGQLLLQLDDYRRLRHQMRHIYGYELEAERLLTLARGVASTYAQVRQAVEAFCEWLAGQSEAAATAKP